MPAIVSARELAEMDEAELPVLLERAGVAELVDEESAERAPSLRRASVAFFQSSQGKLKVITALLLICSACFLAVRESMRPERGVMAWLGLWTAPALPTRSDEVLSFHDWKHDYHVMPGKLVHSLYNVYKTHPAFLSEKKELTSLVQFQISHDCPSQEVGVDLNRGFDLRSVPGITSAGMCQKICTQDWGCAAWSWGSVRDVPSISDVCFVKRAAATPGGIARQNSTRTVGGLPCQRGGHSFWWAWQNIDFYKLPSPKRPGTEPEVAQCTKPFHHCQDKHRKCCAPLQLDAAAKCAGEFVPVRQPGSCGGGFKDGKFTCCPSNAVSKPVKTLPSIHCVMLFLAYSGEQDLISYQHAQQAGIFQCDSHAIYSSQVIQLAPGLVSRRIHHSMKAEIGGQFATVLNLEIFLALYRQLILDEDYLKADWIVKVDPDTVFFPDRLRKSLINYNFGLGHSGIYLNNCPDGLHGPIEVFSQRSFLALADNAGKCYEHMNGKPCDVKCQAKRLVCIGDCTNWWGEDIWVDRCLDLHTKSKRMFSRHLLQEAHCGKTKEYATDSWRSCKDTRTVAFHPFKAVDDWKDCFLAADKAEKLEVAKLDRYVMKK